MSSEGQAAAAPEGGDPTPKRYLCAHTLELVSDAARCTRCRGVWYSSREAQRAHWPIHKKVCRPQEDVSELGYRRAVDLFLHQMACLTRGMPERATALVGLVCRLRVCFLNRDPTPDDELDLELTGALRAIAMDESCEHAIGFLWAAPGMAELLLTGEDLLTEAQRRRRAAFRLGVPEDLSGLPNDQRVLARAMQEEEEAPDHEEEKEALSDYAWLFFNLLLLSAVQPRSSACPINDGYGRLREGRVAEVARRRLFELWGDPDVWGNCKHPLQPGFSLAAAVIERSSARRIYSPGDGLMAPGLPIDAAVLVCLKEYTCPSSNINNGYAFNVLKIASLPYMFPTAKSAWETLPMARRVRFALELADRDDLYDDAQLHISDRFEMFAGFVDGLMRCDDRLALWKAAAAAEYDGEALVAPGCLSDARAFFHYLLRRLSRTTLPSLEAMGPHAQALPPVLSQAICEKAADPGHKEVMEILTHWWHMPHMPRMRSDKDDRTEADENQEEEFRMPYLKLVMSPTEYNSFNSLLLSAERRMQQMQQMRASKAATVQ